MDSMRSAMGGRAHTAWVFCINTTSSNESGGAKLPGERIAEILFLDWKGTFINVLNLVA